MKYLQLTFKLLRETFTQWNNDKAPRMAAALAYYTVFSVAPLLLVLIAISGLVIGRQTVRGEIEAQIIQLAGEDIAEFVTTLLQNFDRPREGMLATILGIVTLLFGAVGAFVQLQDALNTIWGFKPKEGVNIWLLVRQRLNTFIMLVLIIIVFVVALFANATLTALLNTTFPEGTVTALIASLVNTLVSFGVIALLIALVYKVLPDAKLAWRHIWLGAIVTTILFNIGKSLIGLYLSTSAVNSVYGAAGSLVALLIWIFYSAQILLFGAEFAQVHACYVEREEIEPEKFAAEEPEVVEVPQPKEKDAPKAVIP